MTVRLSKSAFVHVPRTGGMWFWKAGQEAGIIKQILRGDYDSHLECGQLPREWRVRKTFSFIRHPLPWIKSRWSHSMENRLKEDGRTFGIHRWFEDVRQDSFEGTLKAILKSCPGLATTTFWQMQHGVDHLIRTEDIPGAVDDLIRSLEGIDVQLNPSPTNATSARWKERLTASPKVVADFLRSETGLIEAWTRGYW